MLLPSFVSGSFALWLLVGNIPIHHIYGSAALPLSNALATFKRLPVCAFTFRPLPVVSRVLLRFVVDQAFVFFPFTPTCIAVFLLLLLVFPLFMFASLLLLCPRLLRPFSLLRSLPFLTVPVFLLFFLLLLASFLLLLSLLLRMAHPLPCLSTNLMALSHYSDTSRCWFVSGAVWGLGGRLEEHLEVEVEGVATVGKGRQGAGVLQHLCRPV